MMNRHVSSRSCSRLTLTALLMPLLLALAACATPDVE